MKRLISFSYDKAGNTANLSRIDPALLGVKNKDPNSNYNKNFIYLHGNSQDPLLCFSLVLVTADNHQHARSLGSSDSVNGYVIKDVAGVLLTLELERLVSVLGLAYELPYVPDDNTRRDTDLLYFSMVDNAFSFGTAIMSKTGEGTLDILYFADTCFHLKNSTERK